MDFEVTTRKGLRRLFSENLEDSLKDSDIRDHVVDVLDDYCRKGCIESIAGIPDTVNISNTFFDNNWEMLVRLGDSYMLGISFFPEYFSEYRNKSRKKAVSMDMGFYLSKGIEAYNYALYLANRYGMITVRYQETAKKVSISLLSWLSDAFTCCVRSILLMRKEICGKEVVTDPMLARDLQRLLDYHPDYRPFEVIQGGGTDLYKDKARDSRNKMQHLRIIK